MVYKKGLLPRQAYSFYLELQRIITMSPIFIVLLIAAAVSAAPKKCGKNAYWSTCASRCPPSCEDLHNPIFCPAVCVNGCKCNQGYILKKRYNICVKPEHCDIIIN